MMALILLNIIFVKAMIRHSALLAEVIMITGFVFVMIYFTRSKVKEQFK